MNEHIQRDSNSVSERVVMHSDVSPSEKHASANNRCAEICTGRRIGAKSMLIATCHMCTSCGTHELIARGTHLQILCGVSAAATFKFNKAIIKVKGYRSARSLILCCARLRASDKRWFHRRALMCLQTCEESRGRSRHKPTGREQKMTMTKMSFQAND
jgi:hypothetical protein